MVYFEPFVDWLDCLRMELKVAIFYTCFLLIVCNLLYIFFTLRCCDEFFLKCFRNTGCQNLSCHEHSCKVFQEFVLGLDFIVFNK